MWRDASDITMYMLARAKTRSKQLELVCNLEICDIVVPDVCPVFHTKFIIGDIDCAPSIDRLIPELGYVKGNVVVVSMKANRIKNDATLAELRQVVEFFTTLL